MGKLTSAFEASLRLTVFTFNIIVFTVLVQVAMASRQSHIVVVVAASTSINDVVQSDFPSISSYLNNASVGLLSIRTGRPPRDANPMFLPIAEPGCITAGAGAPALADQNARLAEGANSIVSAVDFTARTGVRVRAGNILAMGAPEISTLNNSGSYQAHPGLIGDVLHRNDLRTSIVGNSDALQVQHRESVYFVADGNGVVDYGDVSSESLRLPSIHHAYGVRANVEYICNATQKELRRSSLIVVDCGDTLRADMYAALCMEKQLPLLRHAALHSLDMLVGSLAKIVGPDDYLVVISPNAALNPLASGHQVGWIAISGSGFYNGLLTSPSTRRAGVVVLTDFAPTILAALNLPVPKEMTGRTVRTAEASATEALSYLKELDRRSVIESQRVLVMRATSVVFAVVVALVTLMFLLRGSGTLRLRAAWTAAAISTVPASLILAPALWNTGAPGTALIVLLLTGIQTIAGAAIFRNPRKLVLGSCIVTLLLIGFDLLFGYGLMRSSPAGYSIAESARFYGIGNELMGVALGSAILMLAIGWRIFQTSLIKQMLVSTVLLVLLFILIGSPNLGANIGGALATMPAAVVFVLALRGKRPTFKGAALAVIITVVAVSCIFLVDYFRGATQQTHAARMLSLLHAGGGGEAIQVVMRKVQLNFILVASSLWSRLLAVTLISVLLFAVHLRKSTGKLFSCKSEQAGFLSLVVATIGAFVFNDSGVIAAATCSIYTWMLIALRVMEIKENVY